MTRYTKKNDKNYGCKMNGYMWADKSYNHSRLGIDKLGLLEDIEEELGVDLIKLLRAKEIYYKNGDNTISECYLESIQFGLKSIIYSHKTEEYSYTEYFKDYGKTWALTKEELKNDE